MYYLCIKIYLAYQVLSIYEKNLSETILTFRFDDFNLLVSHDVCVLASEQRLTWYDNSTY